MFFTYVLFSIKFDKIYIGQTSNINKRILEHNSGLSRYTKSYTPWKLIHSEEFYTRSEAMKREKELKTQKGREFIWNIINSEVRQLIRQ